MNRLSLRNTLAVAGTVLALAIAAPAEAARFTINIDDAGTCNGTWQTTGSATSPTVTCVQGSAPPPVGAPSCAITASQTVSPGTSVTLALANCSPSSGLSYSWNQGSQGGQQVSTGPTYTTPLLSSSTTYFATVSANGASTTYQTTVTVSGTTAPPPTPGSCNGYNVVNLGDLTFDGSRIATNGVSGSAVVVGRIVLPNPLPAGWAGRASSIAVFEYIDGQYSKKMYVTKSPCDFSAVWPAYGEGNSMNVQATFQNPMYNAVNMNPGDVWYLTVKNERLNGDASCAAGASCNFAITLSAPSVP